MRTHTPFIFLLVLAVLSPCQTLKLQVDPKNSVSAAKDNSTPDGKVSEKQSRSEPRTHSAYTKHRNCTSLVTDVWKWQAGALEDFNLGRLAIFTLLSIPTAREDLSPRFEREAMDAITALQTGWQHFGLDPMQLQELAVCEVDIVNGRTIVMKLVEFGLHRPLLKQFAQNYLLNVDALHQVDKGGNNLFHLAAMSQSVRTFQEVIRIFQQRAPQNKSLREVVSMMDARNLKNQRPLDVVYDASSAHSSSMYTKLKAFYGLVDTMSRLHASSLEETASLPLSAPPSLTPPAPSTSSKLHSALRMPQPASEMRKDLPKAPQAKNTTEEEKKKE